MTPKEKKENWAFKREYLDELTVLASSKSQIEENKKQ
jgi:hypothetical protein